jgi:hypothetical protein
MLDCRLCDASKGGFQRGNGLFLETILAVFFKWFQSVFKTVFKTPYANAWAERYLEACIFLTGMALSLS